MERRQSKRVQVNRDVTVYSYGVLVAVGTTVDMAEYGAYIRLKDDVSGGTLKPGATAKLVFGDQDPAQNPLGTPARVVREDPEGIGVVLLERAGDIA